MTLWEIAVCVDGINAANNPDGVSLDPPTDEEFVKMLEEYETFHEQKH